MIQHQHDRYSWEFLFIGANRNAIATAASLNIQATHSITFADSSEGVEEVFQSVLRNVRGRTKADFAFEIEDRVKQSVALSKQGRAPRTPPNPSA